MRIIRITRKVRAIFSVICMAMLTMLGVRLIKYQLLMPNQPSLSRPAVQQWLRHASLEGSRIYSAGSRNNETFSSSLRKDEKCPDILAGMSKGRWLTRPLTDFEQMSMDAYLQTERSPFRIPPTFQRKDGRCGNNMTYEETPQYNHMWFKSICNPKGSTPCCKNDRCVNLSVEECRCPNCFDERQVIYPEFSTWQPEDDRCTQTIFTTEEACRMLSGSTIHVAGDSFVREMYIALAILLSGDNVAGALRKNLGTYERNECLGLFQVTGANCRHAIFEDGNLCNGTVSIQYTELWNAKNVDMLTGILKELHTKPKSFLVLGLGIHDNFNITEMEQGFFKPFFETYRSIAHSSENTSDESAVKLTTPSVPIGQDIMGVDLEPVEKVNTRSEEISMQFEKHFENPEFKSLQTRFLLSKTQERRFKDENKTPMNFSYQVKNKSPSAPINNKNKDETIYKSYIYDLDNRKLEKADFNLSNSNSQRKKRNGQKQTYRNSKLRRSLEKASSKIEDEENKKALHFLNDKSSQAGKAKLNETSTFIFEIDNNNLEKKTNDHYNLHDSIKIDKSVNPTISNNTGAKQGKLFKRSVYKSHLPIQDINIQEIANENSHKYSIQEPYQHLVRRENAIHSVSKLDKIISEANAKEYMKLKANGTGMLNETKEVSFHVVNIKNKLTNNNLNIGINSTDAATKSLPISHNTVTNNSELHLSSIETDSSKPATDGTQTDRDKGPTVTSSRLPHLFWMGIHAPGLLKSPHFEAQSADGVRRFNKAIEAILRKEGLPYLNTFDFTDGVLSFDGTHYGFAVNMLKTNMFLTYIKETFVEDKDRR